MSPSSPPENRSMFSDYDDDNDDDDDVHQLTRDLANCKQEAQETVQEYASRLRQIRDGLVRSTSDCHQHQVQRRTLRQFFTGLRGWNDDLLAHLAASRRPETLSEAVLIAEREESSTQCATRGYPSPASDYSGITLSYNDDIRWMQTSRGQQFRDNSQIPEVKTMRWRGERSPEGRSRPPSGLRGASHSRSRSPFMGRVSRSRSRSRHDSFSGRQSHSDGRSRSRSRSRSSSPRSAVSGRHATPHAPSQINDGERPREVPAPSQQDSARHLPERGATTAPPASLEESLLKALDWLNEQVIRQSARIFKAQRHFYKAQRHVERAEPIGIRVQEYLNAWYQIQRDRKERKNREGPAPSQ